MLRLEAQSLPMGAAIKDVIDASELDAFVKWDQENLR